MDEVEKSWHGKTGAEVRQIMIDILERAESAVDAVRALEGTFVFGYYVENPGGRPYFMDMNKVIDITPKQGVIYYDLGNLPDAYIYSTSKDEKGQEEGYILISIESDINVKLQQLQANMNDKVDKIEGCGLTPIPYTDDEKKKITIVNNLKDGKYRVGELFSLTQDDPEVPEDYPAGLYFWTGSDFQRVGGLL